MVQRVGSETEYLVDCSTLSSVLSDLKVVEDFVPVRGDQALVTAGPTLTDLKYLLLVEWEESVGAVILRSPIVIQEGHHYRLGHLDNGRVKYSESVSGPHQPFHHSGDVYFTHEGAIYKNDSLFIGECESFKKAANAWIDGSTMYFEARTEKAPAGWDIWTCDIHTMQKRKVTSGANPCVYNGTLYFSRWSKDREVFDLVLRVLR